MLFNLILFSIFAQGSDFPIIMPKTSGSFLFTESINNQVGFSVNQKDKILTDLFDTTISPIKSELCGPATVANLMAFYKYTSARDLLLKYNPAEINYVNEVREYFSQCKTNSKTGTLIINISECISNIFQQSGYTDSVVTVLGPQKLANLKTEFQGPVKTVNIDDIRKAIKNNYGVILELKWFKPDESDPLNIKWVSNSGHYVQVIGYDYDESFGDNKIILKIINPEIDYMVRDPYQRFDNIEMMKIPKKENQTYPVGSDYILDGFGFKGYPSRAFVKYLILTKPHGVK